MGNKYILSNYINSAMQVASYDKLEDDTFAGRIELCKGVIAFAKSLKECESELQSVLEDWVFVGLKLGHSLPVINGIDLNQKPHYESVDSL
jgi:predicted RNase H-like HicB family nuclease